MKIKHLFLLLPFLCFLALRPVFYQSVSTTDVVSEKRELPFVIVICSYNNAKWVEKNLDSVRKQKYKNYRIIYVDDCSGDGTSRLVEEYINKYNMQDKIILIKNKFRHRKLNNIYNVFHSCKDNEIIVQLDGDDWFKSDQALSVFNTTYLNGYWLVYGQFEFSKGGRGLCKAIPTSLVGESLFRSKVGISNFLCPRTFYAWLL